VANWSFLTNHARVLLYIAHDPGLRLRDIAARVGTTERRRNTFTWFDNEAAPPSCPTAGRSPSS
jgi:hypothetical protein